MGSGVDWRSATGQARRARTRARIIATAFELFGEEGGLPVRIEDIATRAGITRMTFYNHFSGMGELREAVGFELTHDFLTAVTAAISTLDDPRERASAAIRFYLLRVIGDPSWGWSMLNLSSGGSFFGTETYERAEQTVREGIEGGLLAVSDSALGRDLVLGTALAAIASILKGQQAAERPEAVAAMILEGLGVAASEARAIAHRPLPALD